MFDPDLDADNGWSAYMAGQPVTSCPYLGTAGRFWLSGWRLAEFSEKSSRDPVDAGEDTAL